MSKTCRPYDPQQMLLMPPPVKEWLPAGHLAHFVPDALESLDLGAISSVYEREERGFPPYHPVMMARVWAYPCRLGSTSSRKMERRPVEDVASRMLAANNTPDFRTIAEFRKRHLAALRGLFLQAPRLCQKAGLVKMRHVATDGMNLQTTRIR